MKLREIKDIVDFYDDVEQTEELLDKEVSITYYWYYYGISYDKVKEIDSAFKDRDFEKFIELRNKYNGLPSTEGEPLEFFPKYADVVTEDDYDYVARLDITNKSNFNLLDDVGYEHG